MNAKCESLWGGQPGDPFADRFRSWAGSVAPWGLLETAEREVRQVRSKIPYWATANRQGNQAGKHSETRSLETKTNRVSHGKQVLGDDGQTKSGSQAHHEQKNIKDRYVARIGVTRGPTLEPGLGLGLAGERLVAGSLPTGPGRAQPEMATWARLPVGSPPAGSSLRGAGPSTTLELPRVSGGELVWACFIAPQLSRHVLEFTPVNERVASLRLRVGDRSLAVVCAYGPNSSTEYPGLLGVPGRGT
ncbi:hypothetical protein L3Q82_020940 [Scortum barcoo]|uniref:Uncharacterized protein n=1 Tax=Scortum barcoo TaxID=214431 RepID=A0ACB8V9K1_9TELE|nr:hypothetical protein L3Q82_020940 [Scortum barcoo]